MHNRKWVTVFVAGQPVFGWVLINIAGACLAAGIVGIATPVLFSLAELHPGWPTWWVPETWSGFALALAMAVAGATALTRKRG
ncbi:MAG: hypothetical protein Q8N51_03005 [Gammaproteobacteria bacterium]|nr:hypothetical protein [Gammaproteobacteria bacterium]